MAKQLVHSFAIKIASPVKAVKNKSTSGKISRKCLAVVIIEDNVLKARITTSPVEEQPEYLVIPFTEDSYDLKGRTHVFLKEKDKYGSICIIRDIFEANINPGSLSQYDALKEKLLISGYIIRKEGKLYFKYEELVAFTEKGTYITDPKIKYDKPLFNK